MSIYENLKTTWKLRRKLPEGSIQYFFEHIQTFVRYLIIQRVNHFSLPISFFKAGLDNLTKVYFSRKVSCYKIKPSSRTAKTKVVAFLVRKFDRPILNLIPMRLNTSFRVYLGLAAMKFAVTQVTRDLFKETFLLMSF